jgi:hypothetical protein
MTRRKALKRWETKTGKYEVMPQTIWPIDKSLIKRAGTKESTAIHGRLVLKYHSTDTGNVITTAWKNQFILHDLCDENLEPQVGIESKLCSKRMTTIAGQN